MSDDISKEEDSFFNENDRIQSPSDAWNIAYLENDNRRKQDEAHEKGFANEQEQYNVEVMELLKTEFPDALQEIVNTETGEKIYFAGISFFEADPEKYRPTEKSQALLPELSGVMREIGSNRPSGYLVARPSNLITGIAFTKNGIRVVESLPDKNFSGLWEGIKNDCTPLNKISEYNQDYILLGLDFLNRYGKELDKEDRNTIDALKKRIETLKKGNQG